MNFGDVLDQRVIFLHFMRQEGCFACAEAEPEILKLRRAYPLQIIVVEHWLNRGDDEVLGWSPRFTPGYAQVERIDGETTLVRHRADGTMTVEELEKWLELKE